MAGTSAAPACSSGSKHQAPGLQDREEEWPWCTCTLHLWRCGVVFCLLYGEFLSSASDPEHGGPGEGLNPPPARDGEIELYKTSRGLHLP